MVNPVMKLRYYQVNEPTSVHHMKQLFLQQVCYVCVLSCNFLLSQLERYYKPTSPQVPAAVDHQSKYSWADDILGFEPKRSVGPKSLEEEVDEYLTDSRVGTDMIIYWQVIFKDVYSISGL